jgi:ankyrin repeat protein
LVYGANVNMQNENGASPLIAASLMGHTDVVRLLLDHGAQINLKTSSGAMALNFASFFAGMDKWLGSYLRQVAER